MEHALAGPRSEIDIPDGQWILAALFDGID